MADTVNKFGIGRPVRRVEDGRFLTGHSRLDARLSDLTCFESRL